MTTSIDTREIIRIIRSGAQMFSNALWEYWPTVDRQRIEVAEANIILHMGMAFHQSGWQCYAEIHSGDNADRRYDFLALHPRDQVVVIAEAKRLYSAEKAQSIAHDIERIKTFTPTDEVHTKWPSFGVILATTWDQKIAEWWASKDGHTPGQEQTTSWKDLEKSLGPMDAKWGSVALSDYQSERSKEEPFHYLLYLVIKR